MLPKYHAKLFIPWPFICERVTWAGISGQQMIDKDENEKERESMGSIVYRIKYRD